MRRPILLALSALLVAGPAIAPAMAQTMAPTTPAATPGTMPGTTATHHAPGAWHGTQARKRAVTAAQRSGEKPIDHGPNTPNANSAYQGGGVVLQGAPGAPPPNPGAVPPSQLPTTQSR